MEEIDWHECYEKLLPKVFHYFWYRVGDRALAEDLTATSFEKTWKSRDRFRHDLGKFDYWVLGIARKVAVDYFRKYKATIPLDDPSVISSSHLIEEKFEEDEKVKTLQGQLQRLSPRERELIAYKYGAEFSNRQIAHLTGLTESNVGVILYRTVERLRGFWKEGQNE